MAKPEIYDMSIVFVGDINPVIIQPFWLAGKGLIQETEGENAKVEMIHNEIVKFELDWVSFEATRQRLMVRTTKESFFSVTKDLAISIFKILKDTPLKNLGINHILHFKLDEESYIDIGKKLTPFDNWEGILSNPRLLQLEMTDQPRNDGFSGEYRVRITPSELIKPFGVSLNINDHFNQVEKTLGSNEIIGILNNSWEISLNRAEQTYTKLWKTLNL